MTVTDVNENPVNRAPVITSNGGGTTATVSAIELAQDVTQVVASDPDGDAISYSIVGGADAGKFTIDQGNGTIQFAAEPDFEAPGDVDGDNVYDIVMRAFDGALSDDQAIAVSVENVNEQPLPSIDTNSVVEAGAATAGVPTATGNVLANDTDPDAGDASTLWVNNIGNNTASVGLPVQGTYGTLTLNADGTYAYQLNNGDPTPMPWQQAKRPRTFFSSALPTLPGSSLTAR